MKSLRDMPMNSVKQKNAFREAALKVEAERDEANRMMANACEYLSRISALLGGDGEEGPQKVVEMAEVMASDCLKMKRDIGNLKHKLARHTIEAGAAEQRMAESNAVRVVLGFSSDSEDVSPNELRDALARRDARMKAEALEEACRKLSEAHYGNAEVGFDDDLLEAEDMVGDIAVKYRKQAEGES